MPVPDPNARAELIETIHQPWRATVRECLRRWAALDAPTRLQSYMVLDEGAGRRRTVNGAAIADLAARLG